MKPDLICCWPRNVDYPIWRVFIHQNRTIFGEVIVVFVDTKTALDYRQFITDSMGGDDILFLDNDEVAGDQDWRNIAVNKALEHSTSKWIWFTEQDFYPNFDFWNEIEILSDKHDVFGYYQDTRLHPCCIFIKRELLETLTKNFGVIKDRLDHFGLIQEQLEYNGINIGHFSQTAATHLNGLSQNMHLLQIGETPNYNPVVFKEYLKDCLLIHKHLHPDFIKLAKEYIENPD